MVNPYSYDKIPGCDEAEECFSGFPAEFENYVKALKAYQDESGVIITLWAEVGFYNMWVQVQSTCEPQADMMPDAYILVRRVIPFDHSEIDIQKCLEEAVSEVKDMIAEAKEAEEEEAKELED